MLLIAQRYINCMVAAPSFFLYLKLNFDKATLIHIIWVLNIRDTQITSRIEKI